MPRRRRHPKDRVQSPVSLEQWDYLKSNVGYICLSNGAYQVSEFAGQWALKSITGRISISLSRECLTFSNYGAQTVKPPHSATVDERLDTYKAALLELFQSKAVKPNEPWRASVGVSRETAPETPIVEDKGYDGWPFVVEDAPQATEPTVASVLPAPEPSDARKRLVSLLAELRQAKAAKAAVPSLGDSRVLASWRRAHQRPFEAQIRRLQKQISIARREAYCPAVAFHKLRPAAPCDARIKRQYSDIKATAWIWEDDEPVEPEQRQAA
jgi:hypothetical protein